MNQVLLKLTFTIFWLQKMSNTIHNRTKNVLLLGDSRLRIKSQDVMLSDLEDDCFKKQMELLKTTLYNFREENGFGRAISGPQIGFMKQVIAAHINDRFLFVINPTITWRSADTFTMWDDCFSLPDLLCKVRRNKSITVEYVDETFKTQIMENLPQDLSELFQHEIDHLDGVLMIDRIENITYDVIYRDIYLQDAKPFHLMVDFRY
jgi:peptide deformylase